MSLFLNVYTVQRGNFQINIDPTIYGNNLPVFSLPKLDQNSIISDSQYYAFTRLVIGDSVKVNIRWGNLVWDFPYSQVKNVKYDLNYNNPEGDLRTIASYYQIQNSPILEPLFAEAKNKKGNKKWLKETVTWIAKNWKIIAAGVAAAGALAEALSNKNEDSNNATETTLPDGTEINPNTGYPYGENPTDSPTGIDLFISGIKDNIPLIAGGVGLFFLLKSNNKPKKKGKR